MPVLRSFYDGEPPYAAFDFELRGGSTKDVRTTHLFQEERLLATVRSRFDAGTTARGAPFIRGHGEYENLWLLDPIMIGHPGPEPIGHMLRGFTLKLAGEVAAKLEVAKSSSQNGTHRAWLKDAGLGVWDQQGRLVLSTHSAWRDSDIERNLRYGFRVLAPLGQREADIAALCAALVCIDLTFDFLEFAPA